MKLIKHIFYSSFIYNFYEKYILSVPIFKIFIDMDYLREKIRKSYMFNLFYAMCKKIVIKLPTTNLNINYISIIFLIILAVVFPDAEDFYIKLVVVLYSLIYILKHKDNVYFTVCVFSAILLIFIWQYGAKIVAREGFSLWCCASSFFLTYKSLQNGKKIRFLKYIFYINIAACLIAMLTEKNIFYGKIVLYLLPFSLSYSVLVYKKVQRLAIFAFAILISVLIGIREGGAVLSCVALEFVLFCALYDFKYIFMTMLISPVAIISLINRIIIFRREFLMAGITLDNIISVSYKYINNGLKGDVLTVRRAINHNTFEQLEKISLGEQFFIYSILVFILITVFFLGRYIFRLIRKTLILYTEKKQKSKILVIGSISFFAGTSIMALLSSLSGSINTMLVYWILLGFIKSIHKNTGKL